MSEAQMIHVQAGVWHSGYEPHDMPGAWVQTRFTLKPKDGGGALRDGTHRGMMTGDRLLTVMSGGDYYGGTIINSTLRDFIVIFDDAFHDQYRAGVERAYKGKRKCNHDHFYRQSQAWQDGYLNGLQDKVSQQIAA
jgi:hypothetical protein